MATAEQATPPPTPFDLQAYISRYDCHSETYLHRLIFLARHFHNTNGGSNGSDSESSIARQAFEMAVCQMKQAGNFRRYLEEYGAVEAADPTHLAMAPSPSAETESGEPERTSSPSCRKPLTTNKIIQQYIEYDPVFPLQSKSDSRVRLEILEGRLASAQSHLMKESIRTALLALAEFHRERGEGREAWRRAARSREYCANGRQLSQVCLMLVELSVGLREWSHVVDTVSRAEHTVMDDIEDKLFFGKLRVAHGLAHLAEGRYSEAAKLLTSIPPDLTNQFSSLVSAEDLALYGALLGLAMLEREALHKVVIDGEFKTRLELIPTMREALRHYSRAEYGQCLALLQTGTLHRELMLDLHLNAHVPILLGMIRDRCIVQYFHPYSCVSLEKMGRVFGCTATEMEDVVARLISSHSSAVSLEEGARINALEKTLIVEDPMVKARKARRGARVRALKMGVQFARNVEGMIQNVACMENGITAQNDKRPGVWRNRPGRARDGSNRYGMASSDHFVGTDPYESDESLNSNDAMDIENPNEF